MASKVLALLLFLAMADTPDLTKFIEDLGAEDFAKREKASRELERIGKAVLPSLHQIIETDKDPERIRRAWIVVQKIESAELARNLAELDKDWWPWLDCLGYRDDMHVWGSIYHWRDYMLPDHNCSPWQNNRVAMRNVAIDLLRSGVPLILVKRMMDELRRRELVSWSKTDYGVAARPKR